jgi:hypothetical protein
MFPWVEIRSGAELGILIFLAIKAIGSLIQKREDVGNLNARDLARLDAKHDRDVDAVKTWIASVDSRVSDLQNINVARRLSINESSVINLREELYKEFVRKEFCNERTATTVREHNHDHPMRNGQ